ncbi:hypothetical protein FO519_002342 [Halicephalobus sp. NKZ332]|nr:hypothetical protein FO519_002342 [Halicephalobus sp. NKZ332]
MGAKSRYVIVRLASVISGATRVWVRERTADKAAAILFDPAIGRECLFEESQRVKGKANLPNNIMGEPIVEPVPPATNELALGSIAAAIAVVVLMTLIIVVLKFLKGKPKNTFLFVGLSDSGKTQIYSKLIKRDSEYPTYTSMKENVYDKFLSPNGMNYRLVDYPGAERLRRGLYDNWLNSELNTIRGIVFVIDSSTFNKKLRDVAELLYDVFYQLKAHNHFSAPILVVCNKQDNSLAKTEKVISAALEKEFGLINVSRGAALSSTDGGTSTRVLTNTKDEFKWGDLRLKDCSFVPTSAVPDNNFDLEPVVKWIDSH